MARFDSRKTFARMEIIEYIRSKIFARSVSIPRRISLPANGIDRNINYSKSVFSITHKRKNFTQLILIIICGIIAKKVIQLYFRSVRKSQKSRHNSLVAVNYLRSFPTTLPRIKSRMHHRLLINYN